MVVQNDIYVNENATIKCNALNGTITVTEICNRHVKVDGKVLLTSDGARITGKGICKELTKINGGTAPVPCVCMMSSTLSGWQKVSQNTASGSSLLLKNSVNYCTAAAPIIKPITISDTGQRKVVKDSPISTPSIPTLVVGNIMQTTKGVALGKISVTDETKEPDRGVSMEVLAKSSQDKTTATSIIEAKHKTPNMSDLPRTGLLCSCNAMSVEERRKKCSDCKYWLDRRLNPTVANDSKTLRENYDKNRSQHDKYDNYFDKLFGLYESSEGKQDALGVKRGWTTVAHHIISGKQVLAQFPRLVKLAHFCGYDVENNPQSTHGINHYPNCIMLVGYPADYGKEYGETAKSVKADEVMGESRIQWHVGSHQYRFAKNEKKMLRRKQHEVQEKKAFGAVGQDNMRLYLGKRREFSGQDLTIACYADLVKARLADFEEELKTKPVCYKENENLRRNFIKSMEKISHEIKQKLAAFYEKPYRSYPYFVSLEAFLYAFTVPRIVHVILVKSYRQGVTLTPWCVTRYATTLQDNSKSLSFDIEGEEMYFRLDRATDEDVLLCLKKVCGKARHFILLDEEAQYELPFLEDIELTGDGTAYFLLLRNSRQDDAETLQANDSEIAVWLRHSTKDLTAREDLQGDVGVLRTRWSRWREFSAKGGETFA